MSEFISTRVFRLAVPDWRFGVEVSSNENGIVSKESQSSIQFIQKIREDSNRRSISGNDNEVEVLSFNTNRCDKSTAEIIQKHYIKVVVVRQNPSFKRIKR